MVPAGKAGTDFFWAFVKIIRNYLTIILRCLPAMEDSRLPQEYSHRMSGISPLDLAKRGLWGELLVYNICRDYTLSIRAVEIHIETDKGQIEFFRNNVLVSIIKIKIER